MTTRAVKKPKPKNLPDNHLQGKRLGISLPCTVMEESPNDTPTIHGPEDVAKFFLPIMLHKTKEQFMPALLDTKNKIIATPTISIGSLSASVVHPREVFAETIKYPCASIILVHNHPSGDPYAEQGRYCSDRKAGQSRQSHGHPRFRPHYHWQQKILQFERKG